MCRIIEIRLCLVCGTRFSGKMNVKVSIDGLKNVASTTEEEAGMCFFWSGVAG